MTWLHLVLVACLGGATPTPDTDVPSPTPTAPPISDLDRDGWPAPEDCDDEDPAIHPGAADVPGNGIDEDCDGIDAVPPPWFALADADGIWSGTVHASEYGSQLAVGDLDGDGTFEVVVAAPALAQFEPVRGRVYVFSIGAGAWTDADATTVITQEVLGGWSGLGGDVAMLHGLSAHGGDALVLMEQGWMGGMGAAFVLPEVQPGTYDVSEIATSALYGTVEGRLFGRSARAADLDGDGSLEVFVGQPGASFDTPLTGRLRIWPTPLPTTATAEQAGVTWEGSTEGDGFGFAARATWDVTGDGQVDLVVSAPYDPPTGAGTIYVLDEPMGGGDVATRAAATLVGPAGEKWGYPTLLVDDLNGDGIGDLVVSGFLSTAGGIRAGKVYVFYGPLVGTLGPQEADVTITADRDFEWLGEAMAATDFNGDGLRDLAIGVPRDMYNAQGEPGRVLVYKSPLPMGHLTSAHASLELRGDSPAAHTGGVLAGGFDADGDGKEDLVIGAPYAKDAAGDAVGRVYWVRGRALP